MSKIVILLSTYNGEKYLKQQLDSLQNQTYKEFEIIARDDGSSDDTMEMLKSYGIKLLETEHNLGAKGSFAMLSNYVLKSTDAKYIMFCDQDDAWNLDKVEKTIEKMQEQERLYPNKPSDLIVVDENLKVLSPSLWVYQNIDPKKDELNRLLLHNTVTGCTMMINRKLAQFSLPISQDTIMHNWWIAMAASAFGHIAYIDEPLMLYRQHGKNDTGAKKYGWKYFLKRYTQKNSFDKYYAQVEAFLRVHGDKLTQKDKEMLTGFINIPNMGWFAKRAFLMKHKIFKNGFMRNTGLMVFI
jgi:glycosyltransferase involved in cell wall biosynthesis